MKNKQICPNGHEVWGRPETAEGIREAIEKRGYPRFCGDCDRSFQVDLDDADIADLELDLKQRTAKAAEAEEQNE